MPPPSINNKNHLEQPHHLISKTPYLSTANTHSPPTNKHRETTRKTTPPITTTHQLPRPLSRTPTPTHSSYNNYTAVIPIPPYPTHNQPITHIMITLHTIISQYPSNHQISHYLHLKPLHIPHPTTHSPTICNPPYGTKSHHNITPRSLSL